jgi:hypothetical protein
MKKDMRELMRNQEVPCPDCGRGLVVPAANHKEPVAHGSSCICGSSWHVHISKIKDGFVAFERPRISTNLS